MDSTTQQPHRTHDSSAEEQAREIAAGLEGVRERIVAAAREAGRDPEGIRLLPVSKTVPAERLRAAVAAGCRELGENKVQEAAELADLELRWSVIGHLQRNKAKDVAAFAHELQSLDSLRTAEALERRLQGEGRSLEVMVQVNTSGEESKSGLAPEQLPELLSELEQFETLRVTGLMTIAMDSEDEQRVRGCFRLLRQLRDRAREDGPGFVGDGELSMGMSGDLELAIAEGATCVRAGRAIFGRRPRP